MGTIGYSWRSFRRTLEELWRGLSMESLTLLMIAQTSWLILDGGYQVFALRLMIVTVGKVVQPSHGLIFGMRFVG